MQTHALLLDVGRVIAEFDHVKPCAWIASETGHSVEWVRKLLFSPRGPAIRHEEGMSSCDFFHEVCTLTGLKTSIENFTAIWGNIFSESPGIGRILDRIELHVQVALVTNTDPIHWNRLRHLPAIANHFPNERNVFASFKNRLRKPDERLYRIAIDTIGVDIKNVLYIDDVDDYVTTFRKLGGRAEVYNCETQKLPRLERILKSYGYIR